jgi:pimeloyl-ACP methyl ester carboxylesterase
LPDTQRTTRLNFVIGGFCSGRATHEPLCTAIQQESGGRTEFIDSNRWGLLFSSSPRSYPHALFLQARHAARVIGHAVERQQRGQGGKVEIYLYGLSMGAAVAMIVAAHLLPAGVPCKVVLLGPACMRREGFRALASRAWRKNANDAKLAQTFPDPVMRTLMQQRGWGMLKYMSNLPRTIMEGIVLTRTDLFQTLSTLLAAKGIPVFVGFAEHDELFPELPGAPRLIGDNMTVLKGTTHDVHLYYQTVVEQLIALGAI